MMFAHSPESVSFGMPWFRDQIDNCCPKVVCGDHERGNAVDERGPNTPSYEPPGTVPSALALGGAEEQHRLLRECVTDYAIFFLDPLGKVATWNAGAERIFGYQESEIVGQHFSCF